MRETIFDRPHPRRSQRKNPQTGVDGSNHIRVGGQRGCLEAPFLPPPSEPDWKFLLHPALQ